MIFQIVMENVVNKIDPCAATMHEYVHTWYRNDID